MPKTRSNKPQPQRLAWVMWITKLCSAGLSVYGMLISTPSVARSSIADLMSTSTTTTPTITTTITTTTAPTIAPTIMPVTTSPHACPRDLPTLADQLVRDFPGYFNRAIVRGRLPDHAAPTTRVIATSEPEFPPTTTQADLSSQGIESLFFTTLERTDRYGDRILRQGFYQLFLTQDTAGWMLVTVRSSSGDYPHLTTVTAPEETSQGVVAQAVRTWLTDCAAGAVAE